MLQQDKPGDYVICTGQPHSLEEFAKIVFEKLNLEFNKYVKIDRLHYRPVELKIIYGDNSKAKNNLNWVYNLSFDDLIDKLIEDEINFLEWINNK
jgi:GDPmannose 4,6-dehydratase